MNAAPVRRVGRDAPYRLFEGVGQRSGEGDIASYYALSETDDERDCRGRHELNVIRPTLSASNVEATLHLTYACGLDFRFRPLVRWSRNEIDPNYQG